MSRPQGYSIADYGDMISNSPRMAGFDMALRRAIQPGCTVFDIGAGTGIFALLAAKYGAGHVVAIEPDPAILLLPEMAKANGLADKITVIQGLSADFEPRQKADIIISDIRGTLPLFQNHLLTILDARARLLAAGGVLIPLRDTVSLALAHAPENHRAVAEPWLNNTLGLDLTAGHRFSANSWARQRPGAVRLLSVPQMLVKLDYHKITGPNISAKIVLVAKQAGCAHGALAWFDTQTGPGTGFSNAPDQPDLVYGRGFFPFQTPLELAEGDRVELAMRADLHDDEYVWTWRSSHFSGAGVQPVASFVQSSAMAHPLAPQQERMRADKVPLPKPGHAVDAHILANLDGKRSIGQIAQELQARFAQRFASEKEALDHVRDVVAGYESKPAGDRRRDLSND
ncbi:MAG: 50S ribosomal protein L11 methyltransferase [Rhodobacteraceae bacterium]|nr:50S ribosomal protein L11 methyltransferase [Paracoccaceae bacterium]